MRSRKATAAVGLAGLALGLALGFVVGVLWLNWRFNVSVGRAFGWA